MWLLLAVALAASAAWLMTHRRRLPSASQPARRWRPTHGGLPRTTGRMLVMCSGGCGVVGWWLLDVPATAGLVMVAAAAGGGHLASWYLPDPAIARRRQRLQGDLLAALDLIAACVDAGAPLRTASAMVAEVTSGPVAEDLRLVDRHIRIGADDPAAWRLLADDPTWANLARGLARSVQSGTALAQLLRDEATAIRHQHRAARMQQARSVGVRSVLPLMVCYLPAFLLVGVVPIMGAFITGLLGGL